MGAASGAGSIRGVAPPLQIKIDQSGRSPGVPGQAREDLALGTAVQLTAVGGPFDAYLWMLAFKPVDVVAGARSSAALSSATTSTTLVQPIDKAGTYRLGISVDAGFGLGARAQDVAFVTFYAGPMLNADPTGYPRRVPATGETTEHNAPDAIDPGGNVDGWAREEARWKAAQESGGGGGSGVVPATPSTVPERGTSGEGYFAWLAAAAASIASVGLLRLTRAPQAAVAAKRTAGSGDVELLGLDGSDGVTVGDSANGVMSMLQAAGTTVSSLFVQVHSAFGIAIWGDAANGVAIGGAGGAVLKLLARTSVGFGGTYAQFIVNAHPFGLGGGGPLAIDFDSMGSYPKFTLNVPTTFAAPTNVVDGGRYTIAIKQGAGGPYALAWDATYLFGATFDGTVTAKPTAVDIFEFVGDSTGQLRCVGAAHDTGSTSYADTRSVEFVVDFGDWGGASATFDYASAPLPAGARLLCSPVISQWTGIDDPTHGSVNATIGITPGGAEVAGSIDVSVGGSGFSASSNQWPAVVGSTLGFSGADLSGQTLTLRVDTGGAFDLSTTTQGHMVVQVFYFVAP